MLEPRWATFAGLRFTSLQLLSRCGITRWSSGVPGVPLSQVVWGSGNAGAGSSASVSGEGGGACPPGRDIPSGWRQPAVRGTQTRPEDSALYRAVPDRAQEPGPSSPSLSSVSSWLAERVARYERRNALRAVAEPVGSHIVSLRFNYRELLVCPTRCSPNTWAIVVFCHGRARLVWVSAVCDPASVPRRLFFLAPCGCS